jgi:hypothetical protein
MAMEVDSKSERTVVVVFERFSTEVLLGLFWGCSC